MFFTTDDGVKINYHVSGTGKPIVLINGFGGYQEVWNSQIDYLEKMGYQVISYDHRNMGKSEKTKQGHSLDRLTKDLIELVAHLNLKTAVFVGHSMGGSVIYNLLKVKPELVKFAVIVDQTPYMLNTQKWHYGFMNYTPANYLDESKKVPAVHETLHGLDDKVFSNLIAAKNENPFDRKGNLDLLQEHIRLDWRPVVKKTQVPLYVLAARQSPYYDYHFAKWMAAQNEKIEATIVENTGHDIMAEVPDRFNQLVRHFLLSQRYLPN